MKFSLHVLLILAFLCFNACAVNPVTGKKRVNFMSEKQEIAIGQQNDPAIIAQFGLYEDKKVQDFIDAKGQQMAKISHRPNLNYEFKILDSHVINAFAVPGGYIYFTRGIMVHFNNEAQFAGVLGHEIGHVAARHSAEQYTKQTIAQALFIGGLIFSEEFRYFAESASQGLGLLFLKFSRSNETESDVLGVDYSSTIGYNAKEMAEFFKTLDRVTASGEAGRIPEFLSTHPDPGRRYETVHKLADEWQSENNKKGSVGRNSYLDLIDGMVYGEDPKQGYIEDDMFYHPVMKFQYPIPKNWKTVNSPIQVQMAPADGKALMTLSLSNKKSLKETADELIQQHKLTVVRDLNFEINGMPAYGFVSDAIQSDQSGNQSELAVQTILINYNNMIYVFNGICAKPDFSRFEKVFDATMNNFKKLTDKNKINKLPQRIKIVSAKSNGNFTKVLSDFNVPSSERNALAILNGFELNEQIKKGTKIKLLEFKK